MADFDAADREADLGADFEELRADRAAHQRRDDARQPAGVVTPYRNKPELAATVAKAVADRANGVFLVARIVSTSLINRPEPKRERASYLHFTAHSQGRPDLAPDAQTLAAVPQFVQRALNALLNSRFFAGIAERALIFDLKQVQAYLRDLDRFDEERYRPRTKAAGVKALLRPLAYAEGEGLTWDYLWAPIAGALAGGDGVFDNEDIECLLEHAGAYIVRSSEGGNSVYHLYHQGLAEHLRPPDRERENQQQITKTLISKPPNRLDQAMKAPRPCSRLRARAPGQPRRRGRNDRRAGHRSARHISGPGDIATYVRKRFACRE